MQRKIDASVSLLQKPQSYVQVSFAITSVVLKICMISFFLFFAAEKSFTAESEGIVIMRMSYQESKGSNMLTPMQYENTVSGDIEQRLLPYYRIFMDTALPKNRDAGITRADAQEALSKYPANFVLYGTITHETNFLQGRFELYDKRNDRVEYFYASDGIDEYDRLIQTVSEHILAWFQTKTDKVDVLRSELSALQNKLEEIKTDQENRALQEKKETPLKEPPLKEITFRIPVRAGYWTYTERDWVSRVQGTVEANFGLELVPQLQFAAVKDMRNELSISLFAGYRYGINAGNDPVQVHSVIINPGITYHLNFYSNNWALLGIGALFEYGIWHVEESNYGTVSDYAQSLSGMSLLLGYSYRIAERVSIDLGANLYIYFTEGASLVLRPYLGTTIILTGGKYGAVRR